MSKIAAIVPALNEEKTIAAVVKTLVDSRVFDDIIVISDGSTDHTAERAREAGATVHELPYHLGRGRKGQALEHAITHTDAEMIAFFDADLIGLTVDHVKKLVMPVMNGELAMNTGWRDRGPFNNFIQMHFMPLIGGERVMQRSIFEAIPEKYLRGFMIESATNYYCRANKLKYGGTLLPGLTMRKKYQKVGWLKALGEYIFMYWQVLKAMAIVRAHARDFKDHFIHEKHHDS